MKKFKKNKYWLETFFWIIFLFGIEVIFRVVENFQVFDYATLRIFFSCVFLGTVLEFFLSFFSKRKTRNIIGGIVLFIATLYAWAQVGFRNFLGIFISIGTSNQFGAVTSYIKDFLLSFHFEYYFLWIPFLLFCFFFFVSKDEKEQEYQSHRFISGCSILGTAVIYGLTLVLPFMQNSLQLVTNVKLFLEPVHSSVAMNQFGSSMFGLLDIRQSVFPIQVFDDFTLENLEEGESKRKLIDDTVWKEVIDEEKNAAYNTLNRYFINQKVSSNNEKTGYFKGKNVIVIMLESVSDIILNETYFPNFHKMLENGWFWENHYSPRNACATGDNEFSGMTSLYPINTSCTVNTYPNNTYFSAIFEVFKRNGYQTTSFHDLDSHYYPRDIFHKNMGSSEYYDGNRLGISFDSNNFIEWPSDVELMEKSTSIFTQEKPFMTWITTVTAHQPYDASSTYGDKYLSMFDDTSYSMSLKHYLSKLKVTDDALGTLMNELEAKGLLKDTVIILYGDHYPYGLSPKDVQMASSYDVSIPNQIEKTPFLIYQSDLEKKTFTEKTSYMNLLPTVLNLFDLNYDSRFYLGEDLFSSSFSGRVVFADGSWEDAYARYDAAKGTITYFDPKNVYTEEQVKQINTEIYQKKEMSKLAITNNYFSYLEESIQKKEAKQEE